MSFFSDPVQYFCTLAMCFVYKNVTHIYIYTNTYLCVCSGMYLGRIVHRVTGKNINGFFFTLLVNVYFARVCISHTHT